MTRGATRRLKAKLSGDSDGDEEDQGSKRARVDLGEAEARQEAIKIREELEYHAREWRLKHLGKEGELQPRGRAREAEMPGDHTTSLDSSGMHIMVAGTESESLARLDATVPDDSGTKLVFSSAQMVVRLEPTPEYSHPIRDPSVRIEDGAPEGVVIGHHVPPYMTWGYQVGSTDLTHKDGHVLTKVTMVHTQFEHHLMERVEAMSAKVADFTKSYHELQLQGKQVSDNLAAIEAQVGAGKQREQQLEAEHARCLVEKGELLEKLEASDGAKAKAQFAEGEALRTLSLEKEAYDTKVQEVVKEAQHSQNELTRCQAQAAGVSKELENLKQRFSDMGGPHVWSRQQAGTNLECSLSEARDELAEMVSTLADARRHLKQAKSKLGDEIDRLRARVGELEVEAVALTSRAEASAKATKAALSSGSVHTDVWDQSPLTKEAQLMAIKEAGEPLLRTFVAELKEARRMAVARKRRGLRRVTMADIVGLLALCSARVLARRRGSVA